MLCKVSVAALVYRVVAGITSSLFIMRDVQPRVHCAAALSGLHCTTKTLCINDEFLTEKFGWSVLSTDPRWPDLRSSYDAKASRIRECLRRSKMLMKVRSAKPSLVGVSLSHRAESRVLPYTSTTTLLRASVRVEKFAT